MSSSIRKPLAATSGTLLLLLLATTVLTANGQELMDDPSIRPVRPSQPKVLKGVVSTLDAAIEEEGDTIDWYSWYLSAREYLKLTGGFNCPLRTEIRFYQSGRVTAVSSDPICAYSAAAKHFPLPRGTQVKVLILPVRSPHEDPATRDEILRRAQEAKKQERKGGTGFQPEGRSGS